MQLYVDKLSPGNIFLLRPSLQVVAVVVTVSDDKSRAWDIDKDLKKLLYGFHLLPCFAAQASTNISAHSAAWFSTETSTRTLILTSILNRRRRDGLLGDRTAWRKGRYLKRTQYQQEVSGRGCSEDMLQNYWLPFSKHYESLRG